MFLLESSTKVCSSKLTPKSDACQKLRFVFKIGSPQGEEKVQSFREKLSELEKIGESGAQSWKLWIIQEKLPADQLLLLDLSNFNYILNIRGLGDIK